MTRLIHANSCRCPGTTGGWAFCGMLLAALTLLASIPSVLSAKSQDLSLVRERVIDAEFGGVGSVAVDRRGRIYVIDFMAQHIVVFSSDGIRTDTIGRRGRGPGEFTGLGDHRLAAGEIHASACTFPIPVVKRQGVTNLLLTPSRGFVVGIRKRITPRQRSNRWCRFDFFDLTVRWPGFVVHGATRGGPCSES